MPNLILMSPAFPEIARRWHLNRGVDIRVEENADNWLVEEFILTYPDPTDEDRFYESFKAFLHSPEFLLELNEWTNRSPENRPEMVRWSNSIP